MMMMVVMRTQLPMQQMMPLKTQQNLPTEILFVLLFVLLFV
jgi:hypothetical protein